MNIKKDEYGEYYAGYIKLSNNKPLIEQLKFHYEEVLSLMNTVSEEKSLYRYESGKWSIKEVIGHLIDTEIIFMYRALAIARGEKNPLMGYDQDLYVESANFDSQSLKNLITQYQATRELTIALFSGFDDKDMLKRGVVNNGPCTVRALGYIIAGHEIHHIKILSERYLPNISRG